MLVSPAVEGNRATRMSVHCLKKADTNRPMNFLLIASFPESLLVFRGDLLKALQKRGMIVHVAAPGLLPGSEILKNIESAGFVAHDILLNRVGMNPLKDLRTVWDLWRLMRDIRPDAVLGYTIKPVIYGMLSARFAGVRRRFALITGLGYTFQEPAGQSRKRLLLRLLVQRLYAFALKGANSVFFQNPDDQALFKSRQLLCEGARSMVVNGSGVDLARYAVSELPPTISFLLIARLLGDKGVREYVAAARAIRAHHPEIEFKLVGWIDDNPDAIGSDELDSWVTEGTISFLGRLSDVRPAIAGSSVYVLPSYREGTPRTVLEAMAMGRAVVTTDAPGCRETVCDQVNGYLVTVGDSNELAQAMMKFIRSPGLVKEMGLASRKMAESKFDVHAVNQIMIREMGL